jgi:membrane protease YdiL (CAAX protease family)
VRAARLALLVVVLLVVTSVVTPIVARVLAEHGHTFRLTRVYNRVFEVLLIVAIALAWRALDLGGPAAWGLRRPRWRRELGVGFALGLAGIGVGLAVAWTWGGVVPALRYAPLKTVRKALLGGVGTAVIAVTEETLFRGLLLRRLVLDYGPRTGIVATTVVYAIVHALRGGARITTTDAWAGWARTASLFAPLGNAEVWPGIAGLFALGLVLAFLQRRTGSLWVPIGVHAAWVGVFRVGRLFFDIRHRPAWLVGPGWPPLVGGVAGLVAVLVTAALAAAWLRRRSAT